MKYSAAVLCCVLVLATAQREISNWGRSIDTKDKPYGQRIHNRRRSSSTTTTTTIRPTTTNKPENRTRASLKNINDPNSPYALIHKYFVTFDSANITTTPVPTLPPSKDEEEFNENDLGGLTDNEVFRVDGSLLVIRGGEFPNSYKNQKPDKPIDDYQAPYREPKLPPPGFDFGFGPGYGPDGIPFPEPPFGFYPNDPYAILNRPNDSNDTGPIGPYGLYGPGPGYPKPGGLYSPEPYYPDPFRPSDNSTNPGPGPSYPGGIYFPDGPSYPNPFQPEANSTASLMHQEPENPKSGLYPHPKPGGLYPQDPNYPKPESLYFQGPKPGGLYSDEPYYPNPFQQPSNYTKPADGIAPPSLYFPDHFQSTPNSTGPSHDNITPPVHPKPLYPQFVHSTQPPNTIPANNTQPYPPFYPPEPKYPQQVNSKFMNFPDETFNKRTEINKSPLFYTTTKSITEGTYNTILPKTRHRPKYNHATTYRPPAGSTKFKSYSDDSVLTNLGFREFGKRITHKQKPNKRKTLHEKPISLHGDTLVNYRHPRPKINPLSEPVPGFKRRRLPFNRRLRGRGRTERATERGRTVVKVYYRLQSRDRPMSYAYSW